MKLFAEQPLVCKTEVIEESLDEAGKPKEPEYFLEGVFMQANIKNRNGRIYPLEIMKKEVDRYNREYVQTNRAFGELEHPACFGPTTKVLTQSGWKLIKDCVIGENVYSINVENGALELKPITEVINQPYKGKMLHFKNRTIDTLVTPNHKFVVQTRKSIELMEAQWIKDNFIGTQVRTYKIPRRALLGIDRENETITFPGIPDSNLKKYREPLTLNLYDFAGFFGFWLAEGYATHTKTENGRYKSFGFGIVQRKIDNLEIIREMVAKLQPLEFSESVATKVFDGEERNTYAWTCNDARIHAFLAPLGVCYDKYIPHEFIDLLNEEQAAYMLEMFILGDGTKLSYNGNYSGAKAFSTSKRLIEDLSIVATIANVGFNVWEQPYHRTNRDSYMIEDWEVQTKDLQPIWCMSVLQSTGVYLDHNHMTIDEVDYDDNVYCLQVADNHTFLAMDHGYAFWTGNSSPTINLDRVSHVITKIWQDGDFFKARAKILDTPCGRIVRAMIKEGCQLGVSSRALGSVTVKDGISYVNDDFHIITAGDIVYEPSAQTAFPLGIINEDVEWELDPVTGEYVQKTEKPQCDCDQPQNDQPQVVGREILLGQLEDAKKVIESQKCEIASLKDQLNSIKQLKEFDKLLRNIQ